MSQAGTQQRRTTYLISLTLVKVEAVGEDGEQQAAAVSPGRGEGHGRKVGDALEEKELHPSAQHRRGASMVLEDEESFSETERQRAKQKTAERRVLKEGRSTVDRVCPVAGQKVHVQSMRKERPGAKVEGKVGKENEPETLSEAPQSWKSVDVADLNRTPVKCNVPLRLSQRPGALPMSQSSTVSRHELKEARGSVPAFMQSLDIRDDKIGGRSEAALTLGPNRVSWTGGEEKTRCHVVGGSAMGVRVMAPRDSPRAEKLKMGSTSLPGPVAPVPKPPRKGKSRTLDNSDLHSLSEDLRSGKDGHVTLGAGPAPSHGQSQRVSSRDRKMLKFISGIFTKSTPVPTGAATAPPLYSYAQRESSEEEVACANSQEWTLSRTVPELRLGVLGSMRSGKSALVHWYLTGSYLSTENTEGGRYKKEVLIDGQSQLLLIREESGPPDAQFCNWVDAVILVFSLENENSFQEVYKNYSQLSAHRNIAEIPLIVVATQDKISSTNPRVIEDARARQLCMDVRRCTYYETCATYGLNVNRVFTEAAQKISAIKKQAALQASYRSLPNSPSHSGDSTPVSGAFPGQASNGGQSSDYSSSLPSTPVVSRKDIRGAVPGDAVASVPRRRRFPNSRVSDAEKKGTDGRTELRTGRTVPIKQGILLKRSGNSLNKEWKKKLVTLSSNGILSYHASVNDYMQNIHGKEIDLLRVTVKVPGKRPPRAVPSCGPSPGLNGLVKDVPGSEGTSGGPQFAGSLLPVEETVRAEAVFLSRGVQRCPSSLSSKAQSMDSAIEGMGSSTAAKDLVPSSPNLSEKKKKGERRKKSMNQKGDAAARQAEDEENFDFIIVSSTGQTWNFEAQSLEERDAWVQAINNQILASLQSCESSKNKARRSSQSEAVALQAIRNTKGNGFCVDCEAPNPTWASLNLGALICIECSGIHRNLGTHLSRVRSLDLDDWPRELTQVLTAIGNHMVNSIWESCTRGRAKPTPEATREERESWIRAKYKQRVFLAPLPAPAEGSSATVPSRLLAAVVERNLPGLLLLLAHSTKEEVNTLAISPTGGLPLQSRTALHAACQLGDVVMTQLLVWYGSDVKARDSQGLTALTLAQRAGSRECADILLQHGCPDEAPPGALTPGLSRKSSTTSLGRSSSRRGFLTLSSESGARTGPTQ